MVEGDGDSQRVARSAAFAFNRRQPCTHSNLSVAQSSASSKGSDFSPEISRSLASKGGVKTAWIYSKPNDSTESETRPSISENSDGSIVG
jgi:hypothetical protein